MTKEVGKICNLWVHDERFSKLELVLLPEFFPEIFVGDVVEIVQQVAPQCEHGSSNESFNAARPTSAPVNAFSLQAPTKERLLLQLAAVDRDLISKQPQLQISIGHHVASLFDLQARKDVFVCKVDPSTIAADYIELTFKDQYIGRGDMFRLKHFLMNSCVYVGKKLLFAGCIRFQVKELYVNGAAASCGYITQNTRVIFRSESAKYFIFLQMSSEMMEFDMNGQLYVEKAVFGFLPELFQKWKAIGVNHVVSIVLFSRVLYEPEEFAKFNLASDPCVLPGHDCHFYKDFYKVVADWETKSDWNLVLPEIKAECKNFAKLVLERPIETSARAIVGKMAPARQGNVLESVNLALNIFDKHYIDRDLLRTGLSIVVISAGTGLLDTNKQILRLTSERMIEDGIGLDWVCLNNPPLFTVPVFRFRSCYNDNPTSVHHQPGKTTSPPRHLHQFAAETKMASLKDTRTLKLADLDPLYADSATDQQGRESSWLYNIPHWVDVSFYDGFASARRQQFIPRCPRPLEDGAVDSKSSSLIIGVPPLEMTADFDYDEYDRQVFDLFPSTIEYGSQLNKPSLLSQKLHKSMEFPKNLSVESSSPLARPVKADEKSLSRSLLGAAPPVNSLKQDSSGDELEHDGYGSSAKTGPIVIKQSRGLAHRDEFGASPVKFSSASRSYTGVRMSPQEKSNNSNASAPVTEFTSRSSQYLGAKRQFIDPCHPTRNLLKMSSHLRRWHHIFPQLVNKKSSELVKWTSLCTPASLPLTTDYFPTFEELAQLHQEYTYTVSLNDDFSDTPMNLNQIDSQKRSESLLLELIAQRLVQGFQLVTGSSVGDKTLQQQQQTGGFTNNSTSPNQQPFLFPITGSISKLVADVKAPPGFTASTPFYLSMGLQVHRLVFDPAGQNVEVKRYVRRIEYSTTPITYTYGMWPKYRSEFLTRSSRFSYPASSNYNWNYLDHVVSGYQDELTESLRFWRTRFILIPLENISALNSLLSSNISEALSEEELRLAGFNKFIELFLKAKAADADQSAPRKPASSSIPIVLTTFNTSTYVVNELQERRLRSGQAEVRDDDKADRLTKESKLSAIAASMLSGVSVKDRRWHLRFYEKVFIGSECVDWMVRTFTDINSREEAVEFGNVLVSKHVFEHVNRNHRFLDGHYFYRFGKDFANLKDKDEKSSGGIRWFRGGKGTDKEHEPIGSNFEEVNLSKIELSRSLILDLDPQHKSYRTEKAILHYDASHNPKNAYHFQLHWLVCTARLVEDLLQTWARFAEKCGLRLVEAPVEQARFDDSDGNPFHSPVEIRLATPPPKFNSEGLASRSIQIPDAFFETELVKHFGFILDVESDSKFPRENVYYSYSRPKFEYTQYIHNSGAAFLQIREPGKGFLWANNRLMASHSQFTHVKSAANSVTLNADALRRKFQAFCESAEELDRFWIDVTGKLSTSKGLGTILDELIDEVAKNDQQLIVNRETPDVPRVYDPPMSLVAPSLTPPPLDTPKLAEDQMDPSSIRDSRTNSSESVDSLRESSSLISRRFRAFSVNSMNTLQPVLSNMFAGSSSRTSLALSGNAAANDLVAGKKKVSNEEAQREEDASGDRLEAPRRNHSRGSST